MTIQPSSTPISNKSLKPLPFSLTNPQMGDSPPPPLPSSSQSHSLKSNLGMLYYGLVVVGTAALVLVVYNLIVVRWCAQNYRRSREEGLIRTMHNASTQAQNQGRTRNRNLDSDSYNIGLVSSFRYKKGEEEVKDNLAYDSECSVCLSGFEEGEEVRQLPRCKHSFHAPCIDMWLYSHSDCPVCRTKVVVPPPEKNRCTGTSEREHPREVLLDPSIP